MSEQQAKPGESGAAAIDLTKYVPKEDFEKISGSIKELEAKLDDAKLKLLDPEYIEFQQSKAKDVGKKVAVDLTDKELEGLTPKQILEKATEKVREELLPDYEKRIKRSENVLQNVLAVLELQEVEKKHSDFNDFREQTKKILETSQTELTIEQAYLLAKASAKTEKTSSEKTSDAKAGTEKPSGTVPASSVTPKSFKNNMEAGKDAWDSIVGSKDTL